MKNIFHAEKIDHKILLLQRSTQINQLSPLLKRAGLLMYPWANNKKMSFKVHCTPQAAWDRRSVHPPKILCFKYSTKFKATSKISPKK